MMVKTVLVLVFLAVATMGPAVAQQQPSQGAAKQSGQTEAEPVQRVAVLRALDKITARVTTIEAPIGQPVRFGTLELVARTCSKRPPEEPPDSVVFLEIDEVRKNQGRVRLFSGWMFASSPALSALEHPVYDVWVIDCKIAAPDESSGKR